MYIQDVIRAASAQLLRIGTTDVRGRSFDWKTQSVAKTLSNGAAAKLLFLWNETH